METTLCADIDVAYLQPRCNGQFGQFGDLEVHTMAPRSSTAQLRDRDLSDSTMRWAKSNK
jgi:hypothetical protein